MINNDSTLFESSESSKLTTNCFTSPISIPDWLRIIHEGRGSTANGFDGYVTVLANYTGDGVKTGISSIGDHSTILLQHKNDLGCGNEPDDQLNADLKNRRGHVAGAQLWFDSHGFITKLDVTMPCNSFAAKHLKLLITNYITLPNYSGAMLEREDGYSSRRSRT